MYAIVALDVSPVEVVVCPIKWIIDMNITKWANEGINQSEWTTVFYSSNLDIEPNFSLAISKTFSNDPACYMARIWKIEGKITKNYAAVANIIYC